MKSPRSLAAALAVLATLGLAACGDDHGSANTDSEGMYVTVDNLRYQVQISRQLNPTDTEDRDYLTGVSSFESTIKPDEVWFGVFIRVENNHKAGPSLPTAPKFSMEDTQHNEFETVPAKNLIAYEPTTLGPKETFPRGTEAAAYAPTQGKLLLFKVPDSSLANRPLELTIVGADGAKGTVEIDV